MHKKRGIGIDRCFFGFSEADGFFGKAESQAFEVYRFHRSAAGGDSGMINGRIHRLRKKLLARHLYKNVFLNDSVILSNFILRYYR